MSFPLKQVPVVTSTVTTARGWQWYDQHQVSHNPDSWPQNAWVQLNKYKENKCWALIRFLIPEPRGCIFFSCTRVLMQAHLHILVVTMPSPGAGAGCAAAPHGWCGSSNPSASSYFIATRTQHHLLQRPGLRLLLTLAQAWSASCFAHWHLMGCQDDTNLEAMHGPLQGEESGTYLNKCSLPRTSPARGTAETLLSEIPPGSKTARWLSTDSGQLPHEKELPSLALWSWDSHCPLSAERAIQSLDPLRSFPE